MPTCQEKEAPPRTRSPHTRQPQTDYQRQSIGVEQQTPAPHTHSAQPLVDSYSQWQLLLIDQRERERQLEELKIMKQRQAGVQTWLKNSHGFLQQGYLIEQGFSILKNERWLDEQLSEELGRGTSRRKLWGWRETTVLRDMAQGLRRARKSTTRSAG